MRWNGDLQFFCKVEGTSDYEVCPEGDDIEKLAPAPSFAKRVIDSIEAKAKELAGHPEIQ